MKTKLWCRVFGHTFLTIDSNGIYHIKSPSNWCRHCGLRKQDIGGKHVDNKRKIR